jgi:hypothetical protein
MAINRTSSFKDPLSLPPWIVAPNGARVLYCCSLGVQNGIQDDIASMLSLTLGQAMAQCVANRGDTIIVLPGHVETVTTTPTFLAGVTVVGIGTGDERPTFNWTTAASQWAVTVANFRIINCIMNWAATASTATTKAVTWTGANGWMVDCKVIAGAAGGAQQATIGLELATGADKFKLYGTKIYAPTDAAVPTLIKLTNAVDQVEIKGCDIDVGMSATTGSLITFTTAPTNIRIGDRLGEYQGNFLRNSIASSTIVLTAIANTTGEADNNIFAIEAASGANTSITVPGNLHMGLNYASVPGKYGILAGTAST